MSPHPDGGRYQLTSRIATGGMGEVWRAEDTVLDREVAAKVLKQEYADDPTFRARFEAEARNAAALHHPNVASVFDFGELVEDDGSGIRRPFLIMELVPGQPLSVLLRGGEPMPPDRAADVVAQAAEGIAAAHAMGIVHRDVKPANLLVTPDGTVKITDFGIARAADSAAFTQTGQIVGTPDYISPEQAEGLPATEASDIYALGVVLYECLAGRRPFARDTPIQVALAHLREDVPPLDASVPERLRAAVDKALAKDPAQRHASAAELAVTLRGGPPAASGVAGAGVPLGGDIASGAGTSTRVFETPVLRPVATRPADDAGAPRTPLPAWWPWAVGFVAVLALVVGTAALAGNDGGEPATADEPAPSATASEAGDDRVRVRASDYLGRDPAEVERELENRGFQVRQQVVEAVAPDQLEGTVGAVRPSGLVQPGATIMLEVWAEHVEPESGERDDKDDSKDDDKDENKDNGHEKDDGGDDDKAGKAPAGPPGKAKGKKDH